MTDVLFTRKETAAIIKVKLRTIWYFEKKGLIKPELYINTRPRYTLEAINKLATEIQTLSTKTPANGK